MKFAIFDLGVRPDRHAAGLGIRRKHPVDPILVDFHIGEIRLDSRINCLLGRLVFDVGQYLRLVPGAIRPVQSEVVAESGRATGVDEEADDLLIRDHMKRFVALLLRVGGRILGPDNLRSMLEA